MKKITLLAVLCFSLAGFAQDLSQNLLLHYPFDGNADDVSGQDYHAMPTNVTYVADRFGTPNSACHFNGTSSYVNFPNLGELKPPLPVSFSFWIKYDSANYQQQVVFNTSMEENHATSVVFNSTGSTNQYVINCADGNYNYGSNSRRSYASNSVIETQNWHFITVIVNSETDMQIYVDCVENGGVYSGTGGSLAYSANPGCLGRHDRSNDAPADYFMGAIDDFRYWDKALTPDEINKICDEELSTDEAVAAVNEIKVYPNPASDVLHIQSKQPIQKVMVYNSCFKAFQQQSMCVT